MSIRITQSQMFFNINDRMNNTLADLAESNLQSTTQLRINRPSDDPLGASRVVSYRASLVQIDNYQSNIKAATGWLAMADSTLTGKGSVQEVLTRIQTLAEQGATGTYDKSNREQISYEIRQNFMQLINLANTRYENRSIFAGHKTEGPAYIEGMGVTCNDPAVTPAQQQSFSVEGGSDKTVIIQFGVNANGTPGTAGVITGATFRYSKDGGATWANGGPPITHPTKPGMVLLNAGGVAITADNTINVAAVNSANVNEKNNGTWFYARPTAVYQGDDKDAQVVSRYGGPSTTPLAPPSGAEGAFKRDTTVRVDANAGGILTYSYSLDDGSNWTQATASATPIGTPPMLRLPVPGGFLNLITPPGVGQEFVIHPHRAEITFAISDYDNIAVNLVGKEVFGGIYRNPATGNADVVKNSGNMFEVVGALVGYAETGSQQGMQQALVEIKNVMQVILTQAAAVGGRENRLEITASALSLREIQEEDGLSAVEDIDVSLLMTKLAKQQTAYNSVLKSSSMIMQMSLVNFL